MGTGIGTNRSLISGIIANGPKCLLIREVLDGTWEERSSVTQAHGAWMPEMELT